MKNIIVHCPTKELWYKVEQKMLETSEWTYNGKQSINAWDEYESESCISILKKDKWKMAYGPSEGYCENNENNSPQVPIIPAEEYLGTEGENLGMEKDNRAVCGSSSDFGFNCWRMVKRYILEPKDVKTINLIIEIQKDINTYLEESTKNQVKSTKE